jgi:hypothetical protein
VQPVNVIRRVTKIEKIHRFEIRPTELPSSRLDNPRSQVRGKDCGRPEVNYSHGLQVLPRLVTVNLC